MHKGGAYRSVRQFSSVRVLIQPLILVLDLIYEVLDFMAILLLD
jgi:hypothetical protein